MKDTTTHAPDNKIPTRLININLDREAWWATVHGVTESWTRLSDLTFILKIANLDDDVEHGDSPTLLAGI